MRNSLFVFFVFCLAMFMDTSASDANSNAVEDSEVCLSDALEPTLDVVGIGDRVIIELVDEVDSSNNSDQTHESKKQVEHKTNSNRSISSDLAKIDWSKVVNSNVSNSHSQLEQLEKEILSSEGISSNSVENDGEEQEPASAKVVIGHLIDI